MKMYLRVLQKATTWPLRLCMIILDTFYWLRNHIKHTKRPNRQCWRFFEPKSPKSRSLMLRFCNPYSFFTEDTIEFSRPFSARTILALLLKRIFFSGSEHQIFDDFGWVNWNPFIIPKGIPRTWLHPRLGAEKYFLVEKIIFVILLGNKASIVLGKWSRKRDRITSKKALGIAKSKHLEHLSTEIPL